MQPILHFGLAFFRWLSEFDQFPALFFLGVFRYPSKLLIADFSAFTSVPDFRTMHCQISADLHYCLPAFIRPSLTSHAASSCCLKESGDTSGLSHDFPWVFSIFSDQSRGVINSFTDPPTTYQRTSPKLVFQVTPQSSLRLTAVLVLLLFLFI